MTEVEYIPFGHSDSHGWKIDGSKVRFWATKRQAMAAARAIGWPLDSVTPVWTRFQKGWAIADGRFGFVSRSSYERLLAERSNEVPAS